MADPSIRKPYDILNYAYYLWIGQILNITAVAVLKYSICAYLLALKFSRVYLTVVWASILMVTTFNLLLPIMGCFCRTPFEANWNKSVEGKCFMKTGTPLTYSQVSPLILLHAQNADKETRSSQLHHGRDICCRTYHIPVYHSITQMYAMGSAYRVLSWPSVSIQTMQLIYVD
jgi:hypothetical protein